MNARDAALIRIVVNACAKVCADRFTLIQNDTSGNNEYFYLDELENAEKSIRSLDPSQIPLDGLEEDRDGERWRFYVSWLVEQGIEEAPAWTWPLAMSISVDQANAVIDAALSTAKDGHE